MSSENGFKIYHTVSLSLEKDLMKEPENAVKFVRGKGLKDAVLGNWCLTM